MEVLIERVKEHEVIYNHKSPDYRDQHIRQTAWEEIGRELQITGDTAKERWDKLRRCFCNARSRRREKTKSGMASKKTTPWKYEQQMSFLLPFLETRKTKGNLNESQTTELEDMSEESEGEDASYQWELGHNDKKSERGDQENQTADDRGASTDVETVEKRYEAVEVPRNKKRKQSIHSLSHQVVQILKESSALRKMQYEEKEKACKTTSFSGSLDDVDMFFLSMSRMTKLLPKVEQARIKLALSNSVLSAEIRCNE